MEKLWLLIFFFGFAGKHQLGLVEGKLSIDVALGLAEDLCGLVKTSKTSKSVDPNGLKKPRGKPNPGDCWVWRWTKCDFNAKQPCSDWQKVPCPGSSDGDREANGASANKTKTFCEIYQCGWTIDELHENWGYNPVLVRKPIPDKPPSDELIETGSLLDFPKQNNI